MVSEGPSLIESCDFCVSMKLSSMQCNSALCNPYIPSEIYLSPTVLEGGVVRMTYKLYVCNASQ